MRESVIYQDIWSKATHSLVVRLLNRRFDEIDESLLSQVQGLSNERVEALGEALLDFSSIDDLVAWLQNYSKN